MERKLRQLHNISDDEAPYPSPAALPTPISQRVSEKRKRDTRLLELYDDSDDELESSIPETTPTARNITCRADGENKAERPRTLGHRSDDQVDLLSPPTQATVTSPAIAHSIEGGHEFHELYDVSDNGLSYPSPAAPPTSASQSTSDKRKRGMGLRDLDDDLDDNLGSPSLTTKSADTCRGDGARKKKRPRRFCDILAEEAKLSSPATQASPDIADPSEREERDHHELYHVSDRELGSSSPISTRPVAAPRPAPRKQRAMPSTVLQLVPLPSALPIATYQPLDTSDAPPGLFRRLVNFFW